MNTLFIGLGGVGCGTLEFLYKRMEEYNRHLSANKKPIVSADYIYMDTDGDLQAKNPQAFMGGTHKTWLSLSANSPDQLKQGFTNIGDHSWEKWYDAGDNPYTLHMGADAKRQFSRLAFKEESNRIRSVLYNQISNVKNTNGRIYVITGSCGGTGCGIYMDVLYMISEIFSNLATNEVSTDVRLIMAMPEGYLDKDDETQNVKRHQGLLNAFATLTELNALCKLKGTLLFNNCYVGSQKKTGGVFRPFHFGYLYDSAGLSRDEVCQRVSDYLFEIELAGNNINQVAIQNQYNGSEFDKQMTNEVNAVWNGSINDDYVKAFCSLGQFSIEKPDDLYRQYFSDRLLFDVINEGLIGKAEKVDKGIVEELTDELTQDVTRIINNWATGISDNITEKDFSDETKFLDAFSVFTPYATTSSPFVHNVIAKKDAFLKEIENIVYTKCCEWLKKYDFTTVYNVFENADVYYYGIAEEGYNNFKDKVNKAKLDSYGEYRKKVLKSEKAKKQFKDILKTWLILSASKALSSGVNDDIKEKDKGYLDICKDFIQLATKSFDLTDIEGWDANFKKRVCELKKKNNRRFIPQLSTITDANNVVNERGEMFITYEQLIRKDKKANANLAIGTCTPDLLHEKVIGILEKDVQFNRKTNINDLLNPDILATANSLRQGYKSKAFLEAYKEVLKSEIDDLLRINGGMKALCADDIVTRLNNCDASDRAEICLAYKDYEETQLKTVSLSQGANQVYKFSYSNFQGDVELMKMLGILDSTGQTPACSANVDDGFFGDKIVKLIVKTGFNIGHYRYYEDTYKQYAIKQMPTQQTHDPFIDKRFKGESDSNGNYVCDICASLQRIAQDEIAADAARSFSLVSGFKDVDIYRYCLFLLEQYFSLLKRQKIIDNKLKTGIVKKGNMITISDFEYKKAIRSYILGKPHSFNLTKVNINDIINLNNWIDYIEGLKSNIVDEVSLYVNANIYFDSKIDENLIDKVTEMMGDDTKPAYDFFIAFKDWYKNITKK